MHRTYGYRDFIIEVDTESVGRLASGKVLSLPAGYVAVVHITSAVSTETIQTLRVDRDNGSPFATAVEALMRGYGAAERVIDEVIAMSGPGAVH
jgi:hypothetical protein